MIKYPLATSTWDDAELQAIKNVIAKDMYTMGEYVQSFENDFAKFLGSKYCVMVNSGSSANLLAVAALFYKKNDPLKKGDEVIVPAVSWSTSYYPLYQYGLKLKFVDIDINTLNYDLEALEAAVNDKTRMILAVNLLGNPNNFDRINKIIGDKNIILLEDNCESLGATFKGKQAGTFGIMGTFSTFYSHHIATMEGGVISTDDKELYHILLSLRSHGWTRHLPKENEVSDKGEDWFKESFRFVLPGYNVRPVEMSGAIGIEQLKKLDDFIKVRRSNAQYFKELFSGNDEFILQEELGESSWFGFSIILKDSAKYRRDELVELLTNKGVDCRPIVTGDFTKNEVLKYFDYEIHGEMKSAQKLDTNGLFVGNHQIDLRDQINYLYSII